MNFMHPRTNWSKKTARSSAVILGVIACIAVVLITLVIVLPSLSSVQISSTANSSAQTQPVESKPNAHNTATRASTAETDSSDVNITSAGEAPSPVKPATKIIHLAAQVVVPEGTADLGGFTVSLQISESETLDHSPTQRYETIATSQTNSAGQAQLTFGSEYVHSPLRKPRVLMSKPGFATINARLMGFPDGTFSTNFPRVELPAFRAESTISGSVKQVTKLPVASAKVGSDVFPLQQQNYEHALHHDHLPSINYYLVSETVSDESGRFTLTGFPKRWNFFVPAFAEGFASSATINSIQEGSDEALIILRSTNCTLAGHIRNENGTPIPNAAIYVQTNNSIQHLYPLNDQKSNSTLSDASGNFKLENLPTGHTYVFATPSVGIQYSYNPNIVELTNNETSTVEIILPNPVTIFGTVVDDVTDEPIGNILLGANFEVNPETKEGKLVESMTTNPDGSFELKVQFWGEGTMLFVQTPEGYSTNPGMPFFTKYFNENEIVADKIETTIRLMPTEVTDGIVYLADGITPAANATVLTLLEFYSSNMPIATTNAEGRYSINKMVNMPYGISVSHESGWGYHPRLEFEDKPTSITLQPYGVISGNVLFPKVTKPVAVYLTLRMNKENPLSNDKTQYLESNADGSFYIDKLPAGTYSIQLRNNRTNNNIVINAGVENILVESGKITENVKIVIEEGDTIVGTVLDSEGNAIEGADVNFSSLGSYNSTKTDKEGIFEIQTSKKDAIIDYINVGKEGYNYAFRRDISIYASPIIFELSALGEFTIQAVDSISKKPLTNYSYIQYSDAWLNQPTTSELIVVQNQEGKAHLKNLPNRPVKINILELNSSGRPTGRKGTARITNGETQSPHMIEVGKTYSASGVVVENNGDVAKGASVMLLLHNQQGVRNFQNKDQWKLYDETLRIEPVQTNAKGEFKLEGLPMGTYGLIALREDENSPTVDLEIPFRDVNDITLTLESKAEIKGTVYGLDGKPIGKGVRIITRQEGVNGINQITIQKDGTYSIPNLDPGSYRVSFYIEKEGAGEQKQVELKSGEIKVLDIDFSDYIKISGKITKSPTGKLPESSFISLNKASDHDTAILDTLSTQYNEKNNYTRYVKPDFYIAKLQDRSGYSFIIKDFEVLKDKSEQEHDITFTTAKGFIILEPEDDDIIIEGRINLEQRLPSGVYQLRGGSFTQNINNLIEQFPTGEYRATYTSRNNLHKGSSDWTQITEGGENILVIFVNKNTDDDSLIGRLQQALKNLGYNPGPIDGLWGSMTSNALLKYQEDNNLEQTGQINEESKNALGL